MSDPTPIRDLPKIYKYFRQEGYMKSFLQGELWIGTLGAWRASAEKGVGDAQEGIERYIPNTIHGSGDEPEVREMAHRLGVGIRPGMQYVSMIGCTRTNYIEDAYALCTAEFMSDELAATLGPYCVEINRPGRFFDLLDRRMQRFKAVEAGQLDRATYTPNEFKDLEPRPGPIGFVKRPEDGSTETDYAAQTEIRMLWLDGVNLPLSSFSLAVPGIARLLRRVK